jgi:rhodanese-related sulfurtransferase
MIQLQEVLENAQTKFIDVRTPQEFDAGHFPGARNIPLDALLDATDELKEFHQPIVLYCRSGARSASAVMLLKEAGLENVFNGGGLENLLVLTQKNLN